MHWIHLNTGNMIFLTFKMCGSWKRINKFNANLQVLLVQMFWMGLYNQDQLFVAVQLKQRMSQIHDCAHSLVLNNKYVALYTYDSRFIKKMQLTLTNSKNYYFFFIFCLLAIWFLMKYFIPLQSRLSKAPADISLQVMHSLLFGTLPSRTRWSKQSNTAFSSSRVHSWWCCFPGRKKLYVNICEDPLSQWR